MIKPLNRRDIRSFVIREGRMTPGQKNALQNHWPAFGLEVEDGPCDLDAQFARNNPVVLEIGFGMGDSLFEMAMAHPDLNFIGVEVHKPGVGHLLKLAGDAGCENLRVYRADSIDVLTNNIPEGSLARIQIFFPDPWHKKKHHKRRLINADFAELLQSRLKPDGMVHIATDWAPYAEWIREVMSGWQVASPPARPVTKYERRGIRLNHEVFDLAWLPASGDQ